MSDTGKQNPLGVNVLGSFLVNTGLNINPVAESYIGKSKTNSQYDMGKLVNGTVLRLLTYAINDAYARGVAVSGPEKTVTNSTYDNLISIGEDQVEALGNAKPPTFKDNDPSGKWTDAGTPAATSYGISGNTGQGQEASWIPYDTSNPNKSVTQWGYARLHALQAWDEFNYNGVPDQANPDYGQFCGSFLSASSAIDYINRAIMTSHNSDDFMDNIYSNMDDLITADVSGISLSTKEFGSDLEKLGKIINLSRLDAFGLPSVLLEILGKNIAVTQDLSLLLLTAGLSGSEIAAITNGTLTRPTTDQEQKIYESFKLIQGQNLATILASLQCKTAGLESLADLLDVKKLFPNSYQSLTVPMYNSEVGLPTNSKTYYLIYEGEGVNSALSTPDMEDYVGVQLPYGPPPIAEGSLSPENYQEPTQGFGSYLRGILPDDQAIAAGAFQFTMRQVGKIHQADSKKFAKVAKAMENTAGLSLINGTSKPTNQASTDNAITNLSLGTGPYGTYTFSDMFGCMSGLPYPWEAIYNKFNELPLDKLKNIYQQLFLAVEWEPATATVEVTPTYTNVQHYIANAANPDYPSIDPTNPYLQCGTGTPTTDPCCQPRIDTLSYTLAVAGDGLGGGYGRGTAPAPVVTITPNPGGASMTAIVGTDDKNAGSNGEGTFGRITFGPPNDGSSVNYNTVYNYLNDNPPSLTGGNAPPNVTITVECPPTATLPIQPDGSVATGGTNTPDGTTGWASPMNGVVQAYIDQANEFIEEFALTYPQEAEYLNIFWNLLGEQLLIEQRTRYNLLQPVPIPQNTWINPYPTTTIVFVDALPGFAQDTRPHMSVQTLEAISNLDLVGGQSVVGAMRQDRNEARLSNIGIGLDNNIPDEISAMDFKTLTTNGTVLAGLNNDINGYTEPSWPVNIINNEEVSPIPDGIYTPTDTGLIGTFEETTDVAPAFGVIDPIIAGTTDNPVVGPYVPVGPSTSDENSTIYMPDTDLTGVTESPNNLGDDGIPIIQPPSQLDPSNVPYNLDPNYTSSTLLPATLSVKDAIAKVIECNCDCWVK
jgi:hypothetical protein